MVRTRKCRSRAPTSTSAWDAYGDPQIGKGTTVKPEGVPLNILRHDHSEILSKRLILGVDFGTTYSSCSYAVIQEGESAESLGEQNIKSIKNYPHSATYSRFY